MSGSRTLEYLTDPEVAGLYWPAVVTGLALALLGAGLSVFTVLKRMAFVGQGISHSAFGGVGIAAALGVAGAVTGGGAVAQFGIVTVFCVGAALLIGWLSKRGETEADTAIGIVLVGAMAVGAILLHLNQSGVSWETFLFGSIIAVGWADAWLAWGMTAVVSASAWWWRRPLLFWAFDEPAARAWGVSARGMNLLLLVLLALATVTAMKLAGVVLATALLVLPGAAALKLSGRFRGVLAWSAGIAVSGVLAGLVLSFELDWLSGPSIVVTLATLYACASAWSWLRRG